MSTDQEPAALDRDVRYLIYDQTMKTGRPPPLAEIATALSRPAEEVRASVKRLADGRALVLQKDGGEILMANPFSAVPTPFLVETRERSYFGNCIWDALGVLAMLKQDGMVECSCGDCGASAALEVKDGALRPATGFAHFALPAARWWADIVFS